MNRTAVFLAVAAMVVVSIIAAGVIAIIAPEGFLTFTGYLGSTFVAITGFAMSLYGLSRLSEKVAVVAEQTNGRLTTRDREIARLQTALISRGHSDVVANVSATTVDTH